jgi:hypothetical protein
MSTLGICRVAMISIEVPKFPLKGHSNSDLIPCLTFVYGMDLNGNIMRGLWVMGGFYWRDNQYQTGIAVVRRMVPGFSKKTREIQAELLKENITAIRWQFAAYRKLLFRIRSKFDYMGMEELVGWFWDCVLRYRILNENKTLNWVIWGRVFSEWCFHRTKNEQTPFELLKLCSFFCSTFRPMEQIRFMYHVFEHLCKYLDNGFESPYHERMKRSFQKKLDDRIETS